MRPHSATFLTLPSLLSEGTLSSSCLMCLSHYWPFSLSSTVLQLHWPLWFLNTPRFSCLSSSVLAFPSTFCIPLSPHTSAWLTHFIQVSAQISLLSLPLQRHSEFPHSALFFFKESFMIWNCVIVVYPFHPSTFLGYFLAISSWGQGFGSSCASL